MTREKYEALSIKTDRARRLADMVYGRIAEIDGFEDEATLTATLGAMLVELGEALDMEATRPSNNRNNVVLLPPLH